MTQEFKTQVQELLREYCAGFPSQNQAANSIKDVSPATVSNILNAKWDNINDKMWRRIGKAVGINNARKWQRVETGSSNMLRAFYNDSQRHSIVYGLTLNSGGGKSSGIEDYRVKNENAFFVSCDESMNKKTFLSNILMAMGKDPSGTVYDMLANLVKYVKELDEPILVFDEFDKPKDEVILLLITLYNKLEDNCGIIIQGTDYLKKRIERGVALNKKGFKELFSRIGRRFIEIPIPNKDDVARICKANGVTDDLAITQIYNESEADIRRVKRAVHKYHLQNS